MARPHKKGLDYFPWDVGGFDDKKVQLISGEFGLKGEMVYLRLLCKIYMDEGYYYQWGEEESILFAKWVGHGLTSSAVDEIVKGCVRRSLFDKRVFDKFNILTSTRIQETYLQVCKLSKRSPEIDQRYNCTKLQLLKNEFSREKQGLSQEETPINNGGNTTKESKGKETKGKESELRARTVENDLWVEELCVLTGQSPEAVKKYCENYITEKRLSGHFDKYEWNSIASWMIKDFKTSLTNGTYKQQFEGGAEGTDDGYGSIQVGKGNT